MNKKEDKTKENRCLRGGFRENQIGKAFYSAAGADYYRFFPIINVLNDVFTLLFFWLILWSAMFFPF